MAQGPLITVEIQRIIAEIHDAHRNWMAKEIQGELHRQLRIKYRSGVREDWPALSTVQRELARIHKSYAETPVYRSELPWSLGRVTEYGSPPIPPEAIPKVLDIQKLKRDYEPLTIREAKWVGHLHAVTQDMMELAILVTLYARREKNCERAGIENTTWDLDVAFRSEFMTILGYFPGLLQMDWVPDSYKKRVVEAETLKYEKLLGLNLDRPDFSVSGWIVYAHSLQSMIMCDTEEKDLPEELQKIRVLIMRQIAKNEGRIPSLTRGKYLDLLESLTSGALREKSYSHLVDVNDMSSISEELREEFDKLLGVRKIRNRGASAREGQK